jgi:hypothetical protein
MRIPPTTRISARASSRAAAVSVRLATPPVACIAPAGVFDAFGWCASGELEWRRPHERWSKDARVTSVNPSRMAFVMHGPCELLPRELAKLHVFDLGLRDEWALAPWGIDAATDTLFEHRMVPGDLFWLAADAMDGLVWGLHDWAHFHNHGPFEARAWTELQCDATALAWLWLNRCAIDLDEARWERVRLELVDLSRERFAAESLAFDASLLEPTRLRARVERWTDCPQEGSESCSTPPGAGEQECAHPAARMIRS